MKGKLSRSIIAAVCILAALVSVFALCLSAAGTVVTTGEMTEIKADFANYLAQDTVRVENDGYVGALQYTVYYDSATHGKAKGGFKGTNAIVYAINTNTERVGTDSNKTIITDMLSKGYMVVVVDYLNNPLATGHALDDSAQMASQHVKFGHWIQGNSKISAVTNWDSRYFKTYVCPSGYNVLLDQVFWSIDKHSADGTLEKIVENWNTDFKGTKADKFVKWATGDTTATRKTVAKASDGSNPVWYNASGKEDANGLYTKVKYTVASTITDCVNPDGSPLDMDLKMHVVYPTKPEKEVPVLSVSCCWGYPTVTEQCYTDLCSHHSGALFRGYAGAVYEYLWHPMAADDSFGYYDGNAAAGSVTHDHMNYSIHLYNDKLVNTASQRYLRYLALSNSSTYKFDLDKFSCIGLSKGGWFTFLGDSELQTALVDESEGFATLDDREEAIDEALAAFTPRRYFNGHHGETRYQAGKTTDITGGTYVGASVINGGERQPWLTYNGLEIISGVQLTYASNGSQEEDIAAGHSPMFIAAHMNDEYNAAYGSANASLLASVSMDIPLVYFEVDQLHEFAYTPDMFYGVETYDAFFDFAGFYLKGEPIKVFYTDPYNKDGNIGITDKIEILFSGKIEKSEVEKIVITDGESALTGSWDYTWGGTKWIFTPDKMAGNTQYTITVPAGIKGVNGQEMGNAYTAVFSTENDSATDLTATSGAGGTYYTVTAPASMPAGKDTIVFRFAVSNDAANVAELYSVADTTATTGTLIGKVNLKGAGIYEIDITKFALDNAGKTATLLLKTGKNAGTTLIKENDFSTLADVSTKSQAPHQLIMVDQNGNVVTEGGDNVVSVYLNPRVYDAGDINYENVTGILNFNKIIGSQKVTDADYGRRFTITLKFFDTESRTLQIRMSHMTSANLGVMDEWAPYYNIRTVAGQWQEFSFDYVVYDTEYGIGSNVVKTLYLNLSPSGNTNAPIYISHLTVNEIVTDMTVTNAQVAAKELGNAGYKAPTDASNPFSVYNGSTLVSSHATWKAALNAMANGYSIKLNSDYTLTDADLFSDFATKAANYEIDLNGYTVRCENTRNSLIWLKTTSKAIAKNQIVIKNGGIVVGDRPLISYEDSTSAGAGKEYAVSFNNVKITLTERAMATQLISANTITSGADTKVTVNLNGCDINLGDEDDRAKVMITLLPAGTGSLKLSYTVTGGSFTYSHPRWITALGKSNVADFVKDGSGNHTKLYLPEAYTPSTKVSYLVEDGFAAYVKESTDANVVCYKLEKVANSTRYGIISDQYASADSFPFALFKDGSNIGGYATWRDALAAAQNAASGVANITTEVQLLLRKNYTNTADAGPQINNLTNLLIDLGGNSLTTEDVGLDFSANYDSAPYTTKIKVINGTVLCGRIAFIDGQLFGANSNGEKRYEVVLDKITIGISASAATGSGDFWGDMLFTPWTNVASPKGMRTVVDFNDCIFDLTNYNRSDKALNVFRAKDSNGVLNTEININGGEIRTANISKITFFDGDIGDSLVMGRGASGSFPILKASGSVLSDTFMTTDGKMMHFTQKSGSSTEYELTINESATDYGIIPDAYKDANAYPFAVFRNGQFVGAYADFGLDNAPSALSQSKEAGSVILLRRDFVNNGARYNNLSQTSSLTFDLGGYTFTSSDVEIFHAQKKTAGNTSVTVKNGKIVLKNNSFATLDTWDPATVDPSWGTYTGGDGFNFVIDNVDFSLAAGSTLGSVFTSNAFDNQNDPDQFASFELINCEIDLTNAKDNSVVLFDMSANLCKTTATVRGGRITMQSELKLIDGSVGHAESKVIFAANAEGKYISLKYPKPTELTKKKKEELIKAGTYNEADYILYIRTAYPSDTGNRYFVKVAEDGDKAIFDLTSLVTPYGTISDAKVNEDPASYLSAYDHPFFVFIGSDIKFADSSWSLATAHVKDLLSGTKANVASLKAYIVMRRDYTDTTGDGTADFISKYGGELTIDLGGYTYTCSNKYFLDINENNKDFNQNSKITVKNGSLVVGRANPLICINHQNGFTTSGKLDLTFDNIKIRDAVGTSGNIIVACWDNGSSGTVNATFTLLNCEIDLRGTKAGSTLFNCGSGKANTQVTVIIKGGSIVTGDISSNSFGILGGEDKILVGKGEGDKYPVLIQSATAPFPSYSFGTDTDSGVSFTDGILSGTNLVYSMIEDIKTPYGFIPAKYESVEDYPFAVFKNGVFVGAYSHFARDNDPSALSWSKDAGSVIVLRRNFTYNESNYNNLSQTKDNTVFDLGGFTFTTDNVVFRAQKKTGNNTHFTVRNGTFVLGNAPLIEFSAWVGGSNPYAGGYGFTFDFENVNVTLKSGANTANVITRPASNSSNEDLFLNINFKNCNIDTTGTSLTSVTLFNTQSAYATINATLAGGTLRTDTAFVFVDNGTETDGSLKFAAYEGKYTELVLDKTVALGADVYTAIKGTNELEALFTVAASNDTTATYKLTDKWTVDFKPLSNITIVSDLIHNIYIVRDEKITFFSVNGKEYTGGTLNALITEDIGTNTYYKVSVPLSAKNSLEDITLVVGLFNLDGTAYSKSSFTLNLAAYVKEALETDVSDEEETLMLDMLSYARAAYAYYGVQNAKATSEIDAILGDGYDAQNAPAFAGEAVKPAGGQGMQGATLKLDTIPSIRFYLTDGITSTMVSFNQNGKNLEKRVGRDNIGAYVEASLHAYGMCDTVSYMVSGKNLSGSFNIKAYYEWAKTAEVTKNNTALITLVERLAKYSESAKAYKNAQS